MRKFENPEFLAMRKAGASYTEIGKAFGNTANTVRGWVMAALSAGLIDGRYRPWTKDKIDRVRELYLSRVPDHKIAEEFGVSRRTIEAVRRRNRISRPSLAAFWTPEREATLRELKAKGATNAEAGRKMGASKKSVEMACRRLSIRANEPFWTQERKDKARILINSGMGPSEVGRRIGATPAQVAGFVNRSGLKPPNGFAYPTMRAPAQRSYATVAQAAKARAGTKMRPRPKAGPKEDSNVIPLTARPWLTRERGECNYPYGPRGQVHSCCKPVWNDTTMCEEHWAACHDYSRQNRKVA